MTVEQGAAAQDVVTITRLAEAKEIYRQREMRQALYDTGEVVMSGVLVNLHGDQHRARRRLENRLFRRETFLHYEQDLFPPVLEETLAPHVAAGRAELVSLSHELMMNLAAINAGVDRRERTEEETHRLYGYMMKFIEAATAKHHVGDWAEASGAVQTALEAFDAEFLLPSIDRRRAALAEVEAGRREEADLPQDVLTILVRNQDQLDLPHELVRREIAFFLLAGAHTSATAFTRTIDNMLTWFERHPADRARAIEDRAWVQRCVHETVRLAPSSPVGMRRALADVELRDGTVVPAGTEVVIDLVAINTDPEVFGPDAVSFNPDRQLPEDVPLHGLSFGHGAHACIGQELAAGVLTGAGDGTAALQWGLATVAVEAAFARGVDRDPARAPEVDRRTARPYWSSYPVCFGAG
ncbi:cytochrome P450 [Acidimicrobiaceae bacterium USS-CC1]|uniref:Cytochrome P450 n=1 Tax=Acidiferrimicrobium australe TaxID=2664430 RepID=A0ABW9QV79_9ACTN|nr:cytochrome P450 [Acidiferrimicrobium australe]